jgi:hypothetical protein
MREFKFFKGFTQKRWLIYDNLPLITRNQLIITNVNIVPTRPMSPPTGLMFHLNAEYGRI